MVAKKIVLFILSLLLLFLIFSCKEKIRIKISLSTFENQTQYPEIEKELYKEVHEKLILRGFEITEASDLKFSGVIKEFKKEFYSWAEELVYVNCKINIFLKKQDKILKQDDLFCRIQFTKDIPQEDMLKKICEILSFRIVNWLWAYLSTQQQ